MVDKPGLIQIYTGDGKGKTTAAIGLTVRAAGRGFKCRVIQFMKGAADSGEINILAAIPNIKIDRIGLNLLGPNLPSRDDVRESLKPAMAATAAAVTGDYDLVVLDESVLAAAMDLIDEVGLVKILRSKAEAVEVILTGRGASDLLIAEADLVTEMRMVKHPYDKGLSARLGIEF